MLKFRDDTVTIIKCDTKECSWSHSAFACL